MLGVYKSLVIDKIYDFWKGKQEKVGFFLINLFSVDSKEKKKE